MRTRCAGQVTVSGGKRPCKLPPQPDSDYCHQHARPVVSAVPATTNDRNELHLPITRAADTIAGTDPNSAPPAAGSTTDGTNRDILPNVTRSCRRCSGGEDHANHDLYR